MAFVIGMLLTTYNTHIVSKVEDLKALYRGQGKDNLALCHGDLHAGSVMVSDTEVKLGLGLGLGLGLRLGLRLGLGLGLGIE